MSNWGKVVHNKARGHYAVTGTWQGQRCYFSQYQSMIGPVTCDTEAMAERLRITINSDIEKGIFNPARYKKTKPLGLNKFAKKWLIEIKDDISKGTWHGYETAMRLYIRPTLGDKFLPDIGHPDLKRLMKAMAHLSPKTKKNTFGCLHRMMIDAKRDGHLTQLPPWIEFKGKNEVIEQSIKYLSPADQIKIVESIPVEHRPIFLFMMATGCRPSEARAFRKQDVFPDHIIFEVSFGYKGELKEVKQKKAEPFPMTAELTAVLESVPKGFDQWVFINPDTKRPYSKDINRLWNAACDKAGLKRIRLYNAVRHSYACQLLNLGVDKAKVSRLLRHSDPRMIEKYAFYETVTLTKEAGLVKRFCKQGTNNEITAKIKS